MNKPEPLSLSETLMRRGWWEEAVKALNSRNVSPADRSLQMAQLECRKQCVEWVNAHISDAITTRDLLRLFDRYTVYWTLYIYSGKDAERWQRKNAGANVKTD